MISNKTKKAMREELEAFRRYNQELNTRERLGHIPFRMYDSKTRDIFNIQSIPEESFTKMKGIFFTYYWDACSVFGRQLVLKIIDELLE